MIPGLEVLMPMRVSSGQKVRQVSEQKEGKPRQKAGDEGNVPEGRGDKMMRADKEEQGETETETEERRQKRRKKAAVPASKDIWAKEGSPEKPKTFFDIMM